MTGSRTEQQAIVVRKLGEPGVLALSPCPIPSLGDSEVLIRIEYAAVNFADVQRRRGGYVDTPQLPYIPGRDAVGSVTATGSRATDLLGRRVAAWTTAGAYAEYATAPRHRVFPLPDGLAGDVAAASLTPASTAADLLRLTRPKRHESVLVLAAAGGLGGFLTQLASALRVGLVIGAVGSPEKAKTASENGCDLVIEYEREPLSHRVLAATGTGASVIFDSVGGKDFGDRASALAPYGRLVLLGQSAGPPLGFAPGTFVADNRTLIAYNAAPRRDRFPAVFRRLVAEAYARLATGALMPPAITTFPLAEASRAHRLLESRASTGRLLLTMDSL